MSESSENDNSPASIGEIQAGNRESLSVEEYLKVLEKAGIKRATSPPSFGQGMVIVGMGVPPDGWDDEDQESSDEKKSK